MLKKISLVGMLIFTLLFTLHCTKKTDPTDDTINAVLVANVKGLDPIQTNDLYSHLVVRQIYEGLMSYHYLKRPMELQPQLADGMPKVSKDGLTHTFKIKKGVVFHDDPAFANGKGREVVAEDFIYSWKRLADPKNRSTGYWIFDGKIKGLNEWAAAVGEGKADYAAPVEGLQAPDSHTLVIQLNEPYYQLHYVLAMGFASVVAKEVVDKYGEEFLNHPVGTGPFRFKNWVRGQKIELVRNEKFRNEVYPSEGAPGDKEAGFLADAGKKVPLASKLVFTELTEDQPRWLNFMKGNFDFLNIPKDNFSTAIENRQLTKDMKAKGIKIRFTKEPDITYIAFNNTHPILKNKKVRQAMGLAYDTKTSLDLFYNNLGIPAQSPIPPNIDGYDPDLKNPNTQFDIEKAKKLMAEAGYPEGKGFPEITYDTLSTTTSRQMGEFLQNSMKKIGINIKVRSNTWPQFQQKIKTKQTELWGIAWSADYPDAQNFLQLFYSKNHPPGPNESLFSNADFDKLYEEALLMPPGAKRTSHYKKMTKILVEEMPWIYNIHRELPRIYHGWLKNYKENSLNHDFFKFLRVDAKERAKVKATL